MLKSTKYVFIQIVQKYQFNPIGFSYVYEKTI